MKAESTIRKQMQRLWRLVRSPSTVSEECRARAYEAYTALQWVAEKTSWTPAGLIEANADNAARKSQSQK